MDLKICLKRMNTKAETFSGVILTDVKTSRVPFLLHGYMLLFFNGCMSVFMCKRIYAKYVSHPPLNLSRGCVSLHATYLI